MERGHRVSNFARVGSGHGSKILTRFHLWPDTQTHTQTELTVLMDIKVVEKQLAV